MIYIKLLWVVLLVSHVTPYQPVEVSTIPSFVCETVENDPTECHFHEVVLKQPDFHFRIKTKGGRDDQITKLTFDNSSNIHTFPRNFCGRFPNLETIYATCLSLQDLKDNSLTGCRQLRSITFSNNNLTRINPRAFAGLSHLQELHVSDNKLERLDADVFKLLPNLRVLSLSSNLLKEFPKEVIKELGNVEELKLFNNKLTTLDLSDIIKYMPKLKYLYISDNEFSCKGVEQMLPIFKEHGISLSGGLVSVNTGKRDERLQTIEWIHCYP